MKLSNGMSTRDKTEFMEWLEMFPESRIRQNILRHILWLEKRVEELEAEHGTDFYAHKTVEQLAEEQGVKPVENLDELIDMWPGDIDDGFEESIDELRGHEGTSDEQTR